MNEDIRSLVFGNFSWTKIFSLRYSKIFLERRSLVFGIRKIFMNEDLRFSVFGQFHSLVQLWILSSMYPTDVPAECILNSCSMFKIRRSHCEVRYNIIELWRGRLTQLTHYISLLLRSALLQAVETFPPHRIILAWRNRDEKIEASSDEWRGGGGEPRKGKGNQSGLKWRGGGGGGLLGESFFTFVSLLFEDKVKSSE